MDNPVLTAPYQINVLIDNTAVFNLNVGGGQIIVDFILNNTNTYNHVIDNENVFNVSVNL